MTKSILALLLAGWLGGSAWAASSPCAGQKKEAAWDRLRATPPESPEALARRVEAFRAACGLPLEFWPGPKAKKSQKHDHPCGEVMEPFVKALPSPSDRVMQSEEAFELGPAGEILQRWWVPVDSTIDGIAGEELLLTYELGGEGGPTVRLAIRPQGQFRVLPWSAKPPVTSMPCPTSGDLPRSSPMGCWRLPDERSSAERRVAYAAPCT